MKSASRGRSPSSVDALSTSTLDDFIELLGPDQKFVPVLHGAKGDVNRIALFYHGAYLESFGRAPPFGPVPPRVVERIASILELQVPDPFEYPPERRIFFKHAEKARRVLGWKRFVRASRARTQEWLDNEARRSDDPDYLHALLETRLRNVRTIPPASSTIERMVGRARSAAQEHIIELILRGLSEKQTERIDNLRNLRRGSRRSQLQWVKDAPGFASPNVLKDLLSRVEFVRRIGLSKDPFEAIHPDMRRRLQATVQVYSIDGLYGDLPVDKLRAYVACYLHERLQALIDLSVEAFDDVTTGMYRRSESERDEEVRQRAPAVNEKLRMFGTVASVLLDPEIPDANVREKIFEEISRDELVRAHSESKDLVRPADFNFFDYLKRRYTYLRSFFPRFLQVMRFEGGATAAPILEAVRVLKYWNAEKIRKVPENAPLEFVPEKWRPYVCPNDSTQVDRHYYELSVLTELHRSLQSGEVWVVGGRRYGNVEDLLISKDVWEREREECYAELGFPRDPTDWLEKTLEMLSTQIEETAANFDSNPQVFTEDGKVHLKKLEEAELPERLETLKERIHESWPQTRIQDLLVEVDSWVDYTRFFRTLHGRQGPLADFSKGLLATLIAKGCNIGLVKMAALTPGLGERTVRRVGEMYLYENTLRRVVEHFVTTHHSLPIADLLGDESVSMSDGMRVRTRVKAINAAFMPQHFPPGQRAITCYWHVSHQGPGYAAQVFGNDRDAAYVLDQILHIRSELPIEEHYTDTHGATENIFALAHCFGIDFAPRIKRVHRQQLYHPPGSKVSGPFKEHFAGAVDVELIKRHWDDFMRILASIKRGVTSAVLLSQRLSSYARDNPLYRVEREVGRIFKTRHILRVYDDADFRRRISSGLDRVENFNNLARHLFFARRGENWEREFEGQLNRASALLILANACVLWNSVHLSELYEELQAEGLDFRPEDFRHVSPYAFEHIIPYGQYFFDLRRKERREAYSKAQRLWPDFQK